MKTSELTNEFLDYWVAKAEGYQLSQTGEYWDIQLALLSAIDGDASRRHEDTPIVFGGGLALNFSSIAVKDWKPSTNWAQAQPLILKNHELINLHFIKQHGLAWPSKIGVKGEVKENAVIFLRALVASKYGDEVPDES